MPKLKDPLPEWIVPFLSKIDTYFLSLRVLEDNESIIDLNMKANVIKHKKLVIRTILKECPSISISKLAHLLSTSAGLIATVRRNSEMEKQVIPIEVHQYVLEILAEVKNRHCKKYLVEYLNVKTNLIVALLLDFTDKSVDVLIERHLKSINKYSHTHEFVKMIKITSYEYDFLKRFIQVIDIKKLKPK